ncbi:hypothetical protein T08_11514 [Trichinella sp. T8]|nr:hypothetical protein T08_7441 [Trichinella sp. T8]KRZ81421.1 hypothetical protein T08_11514 [Trichinella sp. T8]
MNSSKEAQKRLKLLQIHSAVDAKRNGLLLRTELNHLPPSLKDIKGTIRKRAQGSSRYTQQ